ncbi:MAG TPA: penicillin-binding protein 2 [Patescibacteria group bacterium]|nr:penicillin-binding protein 2 [Patescibacteria group bacterium]
MAGIFDIKLKDKDIKDGKVPGFSQKDKEGSFVGAGPLGPEGSKINRNRIGPPVKRRRVYVIATICLIVVLLILSYVIYLQVFKGSYFRNIAEGNRIRTVPVIAKRGLIYDKEERPLTKNRANFSLIIVPGDIPGEKELRQELKDKLILNLEKIYSQEGELEADLYNKINSIFNNKKLYSSQPEVLISKIDYLNAMKLMIVTNDLVGIKLRSNALREYINPENSFSHVLGYVDNITKEEYKHLKGKYTITDFIGRTGIEKYYEGELKGKNGAKRIEVDYLGREKKVESITPSIPGKGLILSLDSDLQIKTIEVLKKYVQGYDLGAGAIVILNPKNGEILSLASWPTYDNNFFTVGSKDKLTYEEMSSNPSNPFVFRSIAGEYPPGSTIKPVWALAGLSEGVINENTTILSTGGIGVKQWFFADWKSGGHGYVDLVKALAESVNTFFYYLGGGYKDFIGLGIESLKNYANVFGLSQKTGIDLPSESDGFLADPEWKKRIKNESWYIGDTYHVAIGQGDILVTPLQVANYTSAIANGGNLWRPHLVTHMLDAQSGEVEKINYNAINKNIADKKNIELVQKGLKAAVDWGSARYLDSLSFQVAGKTGTAEVGGNKNPHSWFTGYAPFKNPEIVVTVIFENGGEGTKLAVPASYEIFKYWHDNIR